MRRTATLLPAACLSVLSLHCGEAQPDGSDARVETPAHDSESDASAPEHDAGLSARPTGDAGRPGASTSAARDAGAGQPTTVLDAGSGTALAADAPHADASTAAGAASVRDGACPHSGHVTYTLERAAQPSAAQQAAYTKIDGAMMRAVGIYNCETDITKALHIQYNPDVQTADGNANGTIRFGAPSTFEHTRAMHEIAHTVGVGTAGSWSSMLRDGLFTGERATAQLRAITGKADDAVHADSQHFWPYGLNYASEVKSDADLVAHCQMVVALRADLGL